MTFYNFCGIFPITKAQVSSAIYVESVCVESKKLQTVCCIANQVRSATTTIRLVTDAALSPSVIIDAASFRRLDY
jgi:hypothetical protein